MPGPPSTKVQLGLLVIFTPEAVAAGCKVNDSKGSSTVSDTALSTDETIPVGKFKEPAFYTKISK